MSLLRLKIMESAKQKITVLLYAFGKNMFLIVLKNLEKSISLI